MKTDKKHAPHPCLICGEQTENKTYCDNHLALARKPAYITHRGGLNIFSDIHNAPTGRRRESINIMRGATK